MSWYKKIKQSINTKFLNKPTSVVKAEVKAEEKDDEKIESKLEDEAIQRRLLEIYSISGDEKTLIDNIQVLIINYGNIYKRLGTWHGKKGSRDFNILKTAKAHTTLITDKVISTLRGRLEALTCSIGFKNETLSDLKKRNTQYEQEVNEALSTRTNDSKQYNRVNAWIYVFAGVAMVAADIAVSINLVAFFGIGHSKRVSSFVDRITDWELLLFSLGIAFCTIYIKILYDDFVNGKLGYAQSKINSLIASGISKISIRLEIIRKGVIKFLIFIALLCLLYFLAKYRTYFTIYESSINKNIESIQNTGKVPDIVEIVLYSFMGITLVIPVVSGIALSIGLKIFANRRSLKEAKVNAENAEKKFQECRQSLIEETNLSKQLEEFAKEWSNGKDKIELISNFFTQQYNQGFRVGYRQNFGNDLYVIIEEYRNEIINEAFANRINKKNEKTN